MKHELLGNPTVLAPSDNMPSPHYLSTATLLWSHFFSHIPLISPSAASLARPPALARKNPRQLRVEGDGAVVPRTSAPCYNGECHVGRVKEKEGETVRRPIEMVLSRSGGAGTGQAGDMCYRAKTR